MVFLWFTRPGTTDMNPSTTNSSAGTPARPDARHLARARVADEGLAVLRVLHLRRPGKGSNVR